MKRRAVIGAVGFEWGVNRESLSVSNFNLVPEKDDHGLVALLDYGKKVKKVSNHVTGPEHDFDEACWISLSPNRNMLFVVSYVTNVITSFKLDKKIREVMERMQVVSRKGEDPQENAKDIYLTPGGKFICGLEAFITYSISTYYVDPDGSFSYRDRYVLERTKDEAGHPGVITSAASTASRSNNDPGCLRRMTCDRVMRRDLVASN